jgi:hypothetical protein
MRAAAAPYEAVSGTHTATARDVPHGQGRRVITYKLTQPTKPGAFRLLFYPGRQRMPTWICTVSSRAIESSLLPVLSRTDTTETAVGTMPAQTATASQSMRSLASVHCAWDRLSSAIDVLKHPTADPRCALGANFDLSGALRYVPRFVTSISTLRSRGNVTGFLRSKAIGHSTWQACPDR